MREAKNKQLLLKSKPPKKRAETFPTQDLSATLKNEENAPQQYVRLIQGTYAASKTAVVCAESKTEKFAE